MNPEEGGLRPQLLDRFGLMVDVTTETNKEERIKILQTVMDWDDALSENFSSEYINEAREKDREYQFKLEQAKQNFCQVRVPRKTVEYCVKLTQEFKTVGNRGDYMIALASRAFAALQGSNYVSTKHLKDVASLVLHHRRPENIQNNQLPWNDEDDERVTQIISSE